MGCVAHLHQPGTYQKGRCTHAARQDPEPFRLLPRPWPSLVPGLRLVADKWWHRLEVCGNFTQCGDEKQEISGILFGHMHWRQHRGITCYIPTCYTCTRNRWDQSKVGKSAKSCILDLMPNALVIHLLNLVSRTCITEGRTLHSTGIAPINHVNVETFLIRTERRCCYSRDPTLSYRDSDRRESHKALQAHSKEEIFNEGTASAFRKPKRKPRTTHLERRSLMDDLPDPRGITPPPPILIIAIPSSLTTSTVPSPNTVRTASPGVAETDSIISWLSQAGVGLPLRIRKDRRPTCAAETE